MNTTEGLPKWAPRVKRRKIRELYEMDAKGIYDDELIDDVGYGLLSRCRSFIDAMDAYRGNVHCPSCDTVIPHSGDKEEVITCVCGWQLTWGAYFKTIQHKQLTGAEPVLAQFREYVTAFPEARTLEAKVLLIDRLIHGFHWHIKNHTPTRPVAVNLIEGRLRDVVNFLDDLTYSDESTPGTRDRYDEWDLNIEANRRWYPSRRPKDL